MKRVFCFAVSQKSFIGQIYEKHFMLNQNWTYMRDPNKITESKY